MALASVVVGPSDVVVPFGCLYEIEDEKGGALRLPDAETCFGQAVRVVLPVSGEDVKIVPMDGQQIDSHDGAIGAKRTETMFCVTLVSVGDRGWRRA